jgi:hypothetical protein
MSQYDHTRQIAFISFARGKQRKSDSCPSASSRFSNALMSTVPSIAGTVSIPSKDSTSARLSSHFVASFMIRAMSLLMASSCDEDLITIVLLVTMIWVAHMLTDKLRLTFMIWTKWCRSFLSDSSGRRSSSTAFHAFDCTGTAHSSRRIMRSVRLGILLPHLGHPYLFVLPLHSIQCPYHILAEARPLVFFRTSSGKSKMF